jgi:hypothetical protein
MHCKNNLKTVFPPIHELVHLIAFQTNSQIEQGIPAHSHIMKLSK